MESKYKIMLTAFIIVVVLIASYKIFFSDEKNTDLKIFEDDSTLYLSIGPLDSKVIVVEFYDYQCPYCAIVSGNGAFANQYRTGQLSNIFGSSDKVEKLAKEEKLRFIHVPMSFLGQESVNAASAALCANEQGHFLEMHEAIFSQHDGKENNGKYTIQKLKFIAANISSLNQSMFAGCLESSKYNSKLKIINNQSFSAGVKGTPVFYINGIESSPDWMELSNKLSKVGLI
jgi:protein-disulfide isomerase